MLDNKTYDDTGGVPPETALVRLMILGSPFDRYTRCFILVEHEHDHQRSQAIGPKLKIPSSSELG